jgi:cytolysin-activating lysine-acyltransferase
MNRKTSRAQAAAGAKASAKGKGKSATPPVQTPLTVSHFFGEMAWLLTQSPLHKALAIGDMEWLVMPALIHEQFYLFRDGDQPVGLALWAKCTPHAAGKLDRGMIEPENRLTLEEWANGDEVWLVDLIAPFANAENQQRELMIADLISQPLRGVSFKMHVTDTNTGNRTVQTVDANAGDQLKAAIEAAAKEMGPN